MQCRDLETEGVAVGPEDRPVFSSGGAASSLKILSTKYYSPSKISPRFSLTTFCECSTQVVVGPNHRQQRPARGDRQRRGAAAYGAARAAGAVPGADRRAPVPRARAERVRLGAVEPGERSNENKAEVLKRASLQGSHHTLSLSLSIYKLISVSPCC